MRTRFFMAAGLVLAGIMAGSAHADNYNNHGVHGGSGGGQIVLYSGLNFTGEARVYNGDIASLRGTGFNNEARSVEIYGGAWTLCESSNGRGNCQTITRSIRNLGRLGLDCELTSFYQAGYRNDRGYSNNRGYNDGGFRGGRGGGFNRGGQGYGGGYAAVTLYSKDNFRGKSVGIDGPVNLRDIGFNNKADSIAINAGRWIVCTGRDLRGDCDVLGRSVRDLDRIDLDDNISSIAPYEGRGRRGRRW